MQPLKLVLVASHLTILTATVCSILLVAFPYWILLVIAAVVGWYSVLTLCQPAPAASEDRCDEQVVLVPVFSGCEPMETLVPLAWTLAGTSGQVCVTQVGAIRDRTPYWVIAEQDAETCARLRRIDGRGPGRVTELAGLTSRPRRQPGSWVVVEWQAYSVWSLFDPIEQFVSARSRADVLACRGDLDLRPGLRVLVLATRQQQDAASLRLAAKIAGETGSVTVAYPASLEVQTHTAVREVHEQHSHLSFLTPGARLELIRSSAPLQGALQLARGHDLLVVGAVRTRALSDLLFSSFVDRLTARAPCPVIQVRARVAAPIDPSLRTAT